MIKNILAYKLIKINLKPMVAFEILYKLSILLVILPCIMIATNISMKLCNITYLTYDNIDIFLRSPSTILVILAFVLLFGYFLLFETFVLSDCYHASFYHIKLKLADVVKKGAMSAWQALKSRNILIILVVIFIMPIILLPQVAQLLFMIKLPRVAQTFLSKHITLILLVAGVLLVISLLTLKVLYSVFYFHCERYNLKKSCRMSLNVIRNDYLKTTFGIISWCVVNLILSTLLVFLVVLLVISVNRIIGINDYIGIVTYYTYRIMIVCVCIFNYVFAFPLALSFLQSCYYNQKLDIGEVIPNYRKTTVSLFKSKKVKYFYEAIVIILLIFNVYMLVLNEEFIEVNTELFQMTTITAHRGDSVNAPENTLAAVESAIKNYADIVEIDVQQTKDGKIILMHDSSLKRTANVAKYVYEMTYDEIRSLDAGSWFDESFTGEVIPTLDEVIKLAKGKVKLNIEIKPSKYDKNLEDNLVRIIKDNNFESECIVTSLIYDSVKRVKILCPEIKTVYVTTIAFGDIENMEYADGFSIQYNFVTSKIVKNIKNKNKDIYVWTVNNERDIINVLNMGVDNIITDNPLRAKEILYSNFAPDRLKEILSNTKLVDK